MTRLMQLLGSLFIGMMVAPACDAVRCGPGTIERNDECVPTSLLNGTDCADGGVILGDTCFPGDGRLPLACGPNTRFDPTLHQCVGTGGATQGGCSAQCSAPTASTFCVTGTVKGFLDPTQVAQPTAISGIKVLIYDPIEFVTNPSAAPRATAAIENDGCFLADQVPRTSNGTVAITTDDAVSTTDDYALTGLGVAVPPGRNASNVTVYFLAKTAVAQWETQVGRTLLAQGIYVGQYLDATGSPVAGVGPSRPGDEPNPADVFCFRGSPATLSTEHVSDPTGLCLISPDMTETHTAVCGSAGCTCTGVPCHPIWAGSLWGTAPNVVSVQTFQAM